MITNNNYCRKFIINDNYLKPFLIIISESVQNIDGLARYMFLIVIDLSYILYRKCYLLTLLFFKPYWNYNIVIITSIIN